MKMNSGRTRSPRTHFRDCSLKFEAPLQNSSFSTIPFCNYSHSASCYDKRISSCEESVSEIPPVTIELKELLEKHGQREPRCDVRRRSRNGPYRVQVKNGFIAFKSYYIRYFPKSMNIISATSHMAKVWATYVHKNLWDQYVHQYNQHVRDVTFFDWLNNVPKHPFNPTQKYFANSSTEFESHNHIQPQIIRWNVPGTGNHRNLREEHPKGRQLAEIITNQEDTDAGRWPVSCERMNEGLTCHAEDCELWPDDSIGECVQPSPWSGETNSSDWLTNDFQLSHDSPRSLVSHEESGSSVSSELSGSRLENKMDTSDLLAGEIWGTNTEIECWSSEALLFCASDIGSPELESFDFYEAWCHDVNDC